MSKSDHICVVQYDSGEYSGEHKRHENKEKIGITAKRRTFHMCRFRHRLKHYKR